LKLKKSATKAAEAGGEASTEYIWTQIQDGKITELALKQDEPIEKRRKKTLERYRSLLVQEISDVEKGYEKSLSDFQKTQMEYERIERTEASLEKLAFELELIEKQISAINKRS